MMKMRVVRAGTGVLLAVAAGAVLSAQPPGPESRARLEQRLRQAGRNASIEAIEEVVWKPPRTAMPIEENGYPADPHAHHGTPADDSFALVTLLSGTFTVYAAGSREAGTVVVTVTDTASGRLLKSLTASLERPGELVLMSPCICKLAASPADSNDGGGEAEQVIALAVLRVRGKAGR